MLLTCQIALLALASAVCASIHADHNSTGCYCTGCAAAACCNAPAREAAAAGAQRHCAAHCHLTSLTTTKRAAAKNQEAQLCLGAITAAATAVTAACRWPACCVLHNLTSAGIDNDTNQQSSIAGMSAQQQASRSTRNYRRRLGDATFKAVLQLSLAKQSPQLAFVVW